MRVRNFESQLWLPQPRDNVFAFFSDAQNLDLITPPWLHFRTITTGSGEMQQGAVIDHRLRIHRFPLRWRSQITDWDPPARFVDEQIRGPYRLWIHEHRFEERDGGTVVRDHVRYAVPLDFFIHRFFIRPDIERIFAYREKRLREIFASQSQSALGSHRVFDVQPNESQATRMSNSNTSVQPYLFFNGRCEEALEFYRSALGAEVEMLSRFKDAPESGMTQPGMENKVMHASFRIGDTLVMASDGRCDGQPRFEGFSLSIIVPDEGKAESVFNGLAEGGKVTMPLEKTFWAPKFGMLEDRFGVGWMVSVQHKP